MSSKKARSLFFLALIPDQTIYDEVMGFKQEVAEKFGSKGALRSPPHITLHMPFQWRSDREETLVEKLSTFRYNHYPVPIQLDGFDFFDLRVVFVHVVKSEALIRLHRELTAFVRKELNIFNADYKDRGFHPHMTIGFRDLKKSMFPQVKAHYQSKSYQRAFEVSAISLLRHNGLRWEEWQCF